MVAVTLPRVLWGTKSAPKHVLLVHGLGSNAHTMWRLGETFADKGWCATAVDLRGHGDAPRTTTYRISDFADDLLLTNPTHQGNWDVVIGHSIGAASSVVAASRDKDWTKKLVLLDPALTVGPERQQMVIDGQRYAHDHLTEDEVSAENPHWHPLDIEYRVTAPKQASRFALERAVLDNAHWDTETDAAAITTPTLVIGGDPTVDSMFTGDHAARVLDSNPLISHTVISGAGHSPHRDKPEDTIQAIFSWLG
jgi:pimeloyl-ACP methyl ester carboxylesterase